MRILLITSAYPARADDARGTFIHELAAALAAQGLAITVLAPGAPDSPLSETRDGVSVERVTYWLPRWQELAVGLGGIVPNIRRNPALLAQVPALISALTVRALQIGGAFDLVHAHWIFPSGIAGRAVARRHRIPLVLTSHGGDLNLSRRAWPLRALVRWACRAASSCVGVSHAMVEEFVRQGIPQKKVLFIPLGVATALPSRLPTELPLAFRQHRGLRIVYVGSLIPLKSVGTLLQAHGILESRGHNPATLVVGGGPSERKLQQQAEALGLRNVTFCGPRPHEDIPAYIRTATVLVLPSRSEGRGLVLLEAMEAGLPVIASDIPGPRELVRPGETGMLFPVGNADALADCLQRLIDDPRLGPNLGAGGKELIRREKLTPQECARLHIQLYKHLTSRA